MHIFLFDIRYALRRLTQRKLFAGAVIALIALGVGANALLFSFMDGILFKALPVRAPENLFQLEINRHVQIRPETIFNYFQYRALKQDANFLQAVHTQCLLGLQPLMGDQPQLVQVESVSAGFFADLGIKPRLGRLFAAADDYNSGSIPAVISYRFWISHWNGDNVLGKTIRIKGHPFVIAGVLPRYFHGLDLDSQADVSLPLIAVPIISEYPLQAEPLNIYVRLRPGVTEESANARLYPLLKQGVEEMGRTFNPPVPAAVMKNLLDFKPALSSLQHGISQVRGLFANALKLLMGGVVALLFIVCFNVGGLLLAKSQSRRKEFAIRRSVGASSWQISRQIITESLLLSLSGTALGTCLAFAAAPAMMRLMPILRDQATQFALSPAIDLSPDRRILLFIGGACLLSSVFFGALPAVAALRVDVNAELKGVARPGTLGIPLRSGGILVGVQAMLTVLLVSASALMIRTYSNLLQSGSGFDIDHILTFRMSPVSAGYQREQLKSYYQELLQTVRSLPHVRAASLVDRGLMRGKGFGATISPTGRTLPPHTFLNTSLNLVSPGYFETMGVRLIEGRDLRLDDAEKRPLPVVVDQAFAQAFFPGQDVIGRTFATGPDGRAAPGFLIVGLAASMKYRSLRDTSPTYYSIPPLTSRNSGMLNLYVRTSGSPEALISEVRQGIRSIDPHVPIIEVTTMKAEVQNSLWQERLILITTIFFGVAGLLLASAGLYASLTQAVAQHIRDIGIRTALGARAWNIVEAVFLPRIVLVLTGACAGVGLNAVLLKTARTLLYGLSPFDPTSYLLAFGIVLVAILSAALGPISSSIRIDPAAVLRSE